MPPRYNTIASSTPTSFPITEPVTPTPVVYFGVDLSTLEDGETKTFERKVNGVTYYVFASRNRGCMPFPFGCPSISVPLEFRTPDGYWFACLFPPFQPITQLDPTKLFRCLAGFLPHFWKRRITLSRVAWNCFELREGEYTLFIPNCNLQFHASGTSFEDSFKAFRRELAGLLPGNLRFKDALLCVVNPQDLSRHPAHWTVNEGMHFMTDFVTFVRSGTALPTLDSRIIGGNWIELSDSPVKDDITGVSPYWVNHPWMSLPTYDGTKAGDLGRYLRNKWVHFNELGDSKLLAVFKSSRNGLVNYCDSLMTGGDLVFHIWRTVNETNLMRDYKVLLLRFDPVHPPISRGSG